jgi:hypothetical protein
MRYFDDPKNPQVGAMVDATKRCGFLEFTLASMIQGTGS